MAAPASGSSAADLWAAAAAADPSWDGMSGDRATPKESTARRIPVRLRVSRRAALVALVGSGWENERSWGAHF